MKQNSENKKKKVLRSNKKIEFRKEWLIPIFILIGGVIFIAWPRNRGEKIQFGNETIAFQTLKAQEGKVSLAANDFDDYKAKYFRYKFPDDDVFFFVVKSSDGVVRAAFNACDVCYRARKGYSQQGDLMVCNNCGQRFPTERINIEKGGCNPAPLNRTISGDLVVIDVADIYEGVKYF